MAHNVQRYVHVAAASRGRAVPRTETQRGRGVFALVVRSRIMRLLLYSRLAKTPYMSGQAVTPAGAPGGTGSGPWRQTQGIPLLLLYCRATEDNDLYRPVMARYFLISLIISRMAPISIIIGPE